MTQDNDTIDLVEIFQVLKQRKKIISLITLLFILLSGLYVLTVNPVYQVQAMIEVGKFNAGTKDETFLDDIVNIKQKLEYIYGVKSKQVVKLPKLKAIGVNKRATSIFSVIVEGYSNKEAVAYIEDIVKKVEEEYEEQINTFVNTQKELISLTQEDIKVAKENLVNVQKTLENYSQRIMNLTAEDAALAGIYTIQISQNQTRAQGLQSRISALKAKIYNLELTVTPLRIKNTHIVGKVEVLDKPVRPKKVLIVIVAFITGLMFSIFLVFFLSFIQKIKEEK